MADQLGVKAFEIGLVIRAEPPHLAAAEVKRAAGAVKLPGQVDRLLAAVGGARIGKPAVDRGAGLGAADGEKAEHARKLGPGPRRGGTGILDPEKLGFQTVACELDRPRLLRAVAGVVQQRETPVEFDWIQGPNPREIRILRAAGRVNRSGNRDQTARLVADPALDKFLLRRRQHAPIGIESHDRIVGEQLLAGFGKLLQDRVGVLRDALGAGLQQHVDDHVLVAAQLVAQELVLARGTAREQQDLGFAIDDFDVDFLLIVALVAILRRRPDFQTQRAAADLVGDQFELDRHDLAVAAQNNLLYALADALFVGRRGAGPRAARKQLDANRLAGQTLGLQITGGHVAIARIGAGRGYEIADPHVHRLLQRANAHGVDRNPRFAGQFDGRGRIEAGILLAIGEHDHAGDRPGPAVGLDPLAQGLTQPRFRAARRQAREPIHLFLDGRARVLSAGWPSPFSVVLRRPLGKRRQTLGILVESHHLDIVFLAQSP